MEKKLTDEEIVTALKKQPPRDTVLWLEKGINATDILDLIHRLQDEIKGYKGIEKRAGELLDDRCDRCIEQKRKETAEKFAEMVKKRKIEMGTNGHSYCMVFVDDIDEICKEIKEGKE